MDIELTKVSSKGQGVIPQNIRDELKLKEGETLAVSAKENLVVLRKVDAHMSHDDLKTLASIKEAWKEIAAGKSTRMRADNFLKEIETW